MPEVVDTVMRAGLWELCVVAISLYSRSAVICLGQLKEIISGKAEKPQVSVKYKDWFVLGSYAAITFVYSLSRCMCWSQFYGFPRVGNIVAALEAAKSSDCESLCLSVRNRLQ